MYPINIKNTQIQDDLKIIYMSRIDITANTEEKNIWDKYKAQLIEDFTLIDNSNFWEKILLNNKDEIKTFNLYKKLKLFYYHFEYFE